MKLLLALQYWKGDAEAASGLMRLLADLAPSDRYIEADLLISVKWDTPFDMDAIRYAARGFHQVHSFRAQGHEEDWPRSPNGLAYETYRWFIRLNRLGNWNYSGVWLIEPDSVPVARDFLPRIAAEWKATLAARKHLLGFVVGYDDKRGVDHMNGNCIISRDFIHNHPAFAGAVTNAAWDMQHRKAMLQHGVASRLIFSDYASGSTDCSRLFGSFSLPRVHPLFGESPLRPAWVHGWKQWKVTQQCVRDRLIGTPAIA